MTPAGLDYGPTLNTAGKTQPRLQIMPDIVNTPLKKVKILQSVQPRDSIDQELVGEWAELLIADPSFQMPPGVAYQNPKTHEIVLSDAFHRHAAYVIAERTLFPLEIREGDAEDASLNALTANSKHGRQLNRFERSAAIQKFFAHSKRGDRSQADIADLFGVSVTTVERALAEGRKQGKIEHSRQSNIEKSPSNEGNSTGGLSTREPKERFSAEVLEAINKIGECNQHAKTALLNGSIRKPDDELLSFSELDCPRQVQLAPYFLTADLSLKAAINAISKRPTDVDCRVRELIQYAQLKGVDQSFYYFEDSVEVTVTLLAQTPASEPVQKTLSAKAKVEAALGVPAPVEESEDLI